MCAFNLNRVIDVNFYPVPEAENSNMRHRPIGIGVQGLADGRSACCALACSWRASVVSAGVVPAKDTGAVAFERRDDFVHSLLGCGVLEQL